jgi:hypothetical protein
VDEFGILYWHVLIELADKWKNRIAYDLGLIRETVPAASCQNREINASVVGAHLRATPLKDSVIISPTARGMTPTLD